MPGDFYDEFAVHDVDMALWVLNEKPLRVSAFGLCSYSDKPVRGGAVDNATIVLEFANQRSVTIEGALEWAASVLNASPPLSPRRLAPLAWQLLRPAH
jgi:predicted dehydrogenase